MKILAISGSLRSASLNTMLLKAAARLAPPGTAIELYVGLGDLPLFNPDIEHTDPPSVAKLRVALMECDAVLIASPEYAHGVTAVIKNALDWMVGNMSFVNKPVALLNASPVSVHAQASLKEIVTVMSAHVVEDACVAVPIRGSHFDEDGIVSDSGISSAIRTSIARLSAAAVQLREADR